MIDILNQYVSVIQNIILIALAYAAINKSFKYHKKYTMFGDKLDMIISAIYDVGFLMLIGIMWLK